MISPEEFNELCNSFNKKYQKAKKNIGTIESLGPHLIKPIEEVINTVNATECKSGCTHCCNLRVVVYPHELISIYLYLNSSLNNKELEEVKNRINSQYEIIKLLSIDQHFTTNIQCPLLYSSKCLVYKVRPIACAGYHSMSESKCKESNDHPEIVGTENGGIPQISTVQDIQAIQNTIAKQVIESHNDDSEQYELISGLHEIFKSPKIIKNWKNGRKLIKQSS